MRFFTNAINDRLPGFSLIELASVIVITSIVIVGLTTIVFHLINNRGHAEASMLASEHLRSAHYWLSRDGLMSQITQVGDDPDTVENEVLSLLWVGFERKDQQDNEYSDLYEIKYVLENNELRRAKKLTTGIYDPDGSLIETYSSNTSTVVAQGITDLVVSSDNRTLKISLTAIIEDVESNKSFEVEPRSATNF
jgi:type II secretory pathway component PulJ